jgi:hypothetical protein
VTRRGGRTAKGEANEDDVEAKGQRNQLTPVHRLRQLDPSLFFKGQMTSLLASVTENELVSELRGGMVHMCSSLPLSLCRSLGLWLSHCGLSFVLLNLSLCGGFGGIGEQEDPGMYIYVEDKGSEDHNGRKNSPFE